MFSLSACVCLLVFRKQFRKGLAQFLHCLLLQTIVKGHSSTEQTIVKGLQGHSLSLIFAVFHIKKIDPVLKTPILHSHWPIRTCPSCLVYIRHISTNHIP